MTQPLIINNFDQAIADSPHKGFGLMSRVDIEGYPGAVKVGKQVISVFVDSTTSTFTADAGTDVCTGASFTTNANREAVAVYLTTTGTLPAGLSTGTVYFVIQVSAPAGTFKLATTITNAEGSTAINITDAGSGTHTVQTVDPGTINHIVRDERTNDDFLQDSNGRVWFYDGAIAFLLHDSTLDAGTGSFTSASGNGIVLYKQNDGGTTHYLISFRNNLMDIINVYGSSNRKTPSWTNAWDFGGTSSDSAMNTGAGVNNTHYAIVGQDDIVYFCDARYVGSIKEASGQVFDPSTSSTYTGNDQALDLPPNEIAQHLEELGVNLLIAGNKTNKIYLWNRTDDTFSLPLAVPEKSIKKLKNIGGLVYILAGSWGNVYITQGTYVQHFKKIPQHLTNNGTTDTSSQITWGGIESLNGALLFGMSVQTSGNSGAYLLYPDGRLVIDQIPSTGSGNVTAFSVPNNFYLMGYSGGADTHDTNRYTALEGVVQSGFFRVATITEKATYSTLEVILAKPSSAGNVKIGYRQDITSAFINIDTFTADGSSITFKNDQIGLTDIENIQIQAELDDDVELVEIRLLS